LFRGHHKRARFRSRTSRKRALLWCPRKNSLLQGLILALFFLFPVFPTLGNPDRTNLSAAASERVIRYGMPELPPLFFQDEDGSYQGYIVDLLRALSEGEPWEVSFVMAHGDELGKMLQRGELDLLSMVPLPHRDFDLGKVHHYATWYTFFTRSGTTILSFLDLEGKRIAMQGGFYGIYELRRILNGLGLKYELVETQTVEEAMELLGQGKVDICGAEQIPTANLVRRYNFWRSPVIFAPSRIFFAVTKGKHTELLAELDSKLEKWQASPFSPLKSIQRRWFYDEEFAFLPEWARWSFWGAAVVLGAMAFGLGIYFWKERTIKLRNRELRERLESEQFLREAAHVLLARGGKEEALKEMCGKICSVLGPYRFFLLRNTFSKDRQRVLEIFFEYAAPGTRPFFTPPEMTHAPVKKFPKALLQELGSKKLIQDHVKNFPFLREILPPWARKDGFLSLYPIFQGSHLWGAFALIHPEKELSSKGTNVTLATFAEMASAHLLRKKEAERLHRIAATDALTGLPNRRSFFDTLNREIARCHRHGKPLSLILCDIDFFKEVNDTYGHDTGDYVLRQFGRNLRRALRAEDFLSRYGGEEFGMILPETDLPRAIQVAERLRYETEKALFSAERGKKDAPRIQLTASFGVAQLELHKDTREALFSRADLLLYQAKNAGRNSVYPSPESLVSDSGTSSEDKTSS
ncbi:MAG TPA: GGDEF domain-containing protein, partial [Synergistaceae bacterium]|nr:GGDEF domain-containing protein [Synergistaceae bacterium]